MVQIVQHVYKRRLDLLRLREKERVAGWQPLLQTKVKVLSGKDEDYQVWITKFEAYAKVKGFNKVMAGTEVPPPVSQTTRMAPKQKVEEKYDTGYCLSLIHI